MAVQHLIAALAFALLLTANGQLTTGSQQAVEPGVGAGGDGNAVVPKAAAGDLSFPPAVKPEELEACGTQENDSCGDGEICARDVSSNEQLDGVCAPIPVGGVSVPADSSDFPHPVGYFPLSGGSTSSWPMRQYSGFQRNVSWRADDKFGIVAHCDQDESSLIVLPHVPFGGDGGLTINFWMKKDKTTTLKGDAFQYIFSVSALVNHRVSSSGWDFPNQIHIYLPESPHSAEGLVRVIFQDSDDGGSTYYMDSDGEVGRSLFAAEANPKHSELDDGEWHMITVTSLPKRKAKGFRIFVDGELAAETPEEDAHGGHPIYADGDIFLCGRNDHDPNRHFDGALAQLSIFDESLTIKQVKRLYDVVSSEGKVVDKDLSYVRELEKETSVIRDSDLTEGVAKAGTSDLNKFRVQQFATRAKFCKASSSCGEDERCAALPESIREVVLEAANQTQGTGACAKIPEGGLPDFTALKGVPLPLAFFPLTGGDTRSWPVPEFAGVSEKVGLEKDEVFGSVFHCSQENLSVVAIDEMEYGQSGAFALNIWFRATNLRGNLFQYLVSIDDDGGDSNTIWGEQLNVYLGELDHVLFGLVRTVYKDVDDSDDELYVDSDGRIGVTEFTKRTPPIEIQDGNWHMYTFTTNLPGEKGYRVYLDGQIVATVDAKELAGAGLNAAGVPGGDPFTPNGALLLCGRQDLHPERHFEGEIAHLSLYGESLTDENVLGIYNSISQEKLAKSRSKNVPPTYPPPQEPSSLFPTLPIVPIEDVPGAPTQPPAPAPAPAPTPTPTTSVPVPTVQPENISTPPTQAPPQGLPADTAAPAATPGSLPTTPQVTPSSEPGTTPPPSDPRIQGAVPAAGPTQVGEPSVQATAPAAPTTVGSGVGSAGVPVPPVAPSQTGGNTVDDLD